MSAETFLLTTPLTSGAPQPHSPITVETLELGRYAKRVVAIGHDEIKPGMVYVGREVKSIPGVVADTMGVSGKFWRWGNPFKLDYDTPLGRGACLLRYVRHLRGEMRRFSVLREEVFELSGRTLVCWCGPGKLCHGHILALVSESSDKLIDLLGGEQDMAPEVEDAGMTSYTDMALDSARWMPEWDLALGLLESDLNARVEQRHYTVELDVRPEGASVTPVALTNVYSGRKALIIRPDYLPVQLIVRRHGSRVSMHTLSSLMAELHRSERVERIQLWSDGEERGALRLRIAPLDGLWTAKVLLSPPDAGNLNPLQRRLMEQVRRFLTVF